MFKKKRARALIMPIIHFQFGLTPEKVGLVFLASAVPYAAFAPLSGLLADKIVSIILL